MFDAFTTQDVRTAPRKLVLSENAGAAAQELSAALGESDCTVVMAEADLAEGWPQYVVARARTGGAFVVERASMKEPESALKLARGALGGRPAAALVVAGQLIFALEEAPLAAQAA